MVKISIVVVTFNSAETLDDTLKSIDKQNVRPFEVLLIDGASSDETIAIASKYKALNLSIVSEKDNGIYDAMNKGLKLSNGEVIGFLNSDDVYNNTSVLQKISDRFADESIDAVYGDVIYTDRQDTNIVKRFWKSGGFDPNKFNSGWCLPHPTFYIRTALTKEIGYFDISFDLAADYDFITRSVIKHGVSLSYIPEVLVKMRLGGATNKNIINIFRQNKQIIKSLKKNKIQVNILRFFFEKILIKIRERLS